MTARLRDESGQAIVITILFMSVLVGGTAVAIDVGSWYHESRVAQTAADAAALSGAQSLPTDTAKATSDATAYTTANGGGLAPVNGIAFSKGFAAHDTLTVTIQRAAPGFFSRFFGIDSVTVHATATARSAVPVDVKDVAPITVNEQHPDLLGRADCPCFNLDTTLPLGKDGAPGAFGMLDLDQFQNELNGDCPNTTAPGNDGTSVLGAWITSGFDRYLALGCYTSDTGAKFNSNIIDALHDRLGTNLLFPVYSSLDGTGSNAQYDIIGWAAFHLESFDPSGSSGSITGYFTQVLWDGIQSTTAPTGPDLGVHTIALIN